MSPQPDLQAQTPPVRIDKWLWSVRLFKTRTLAANACRLGHVLVDGRTAKASNDVRLGQMIEVRLPELIRTVKVIGLLENRVGPPRVKEFAEDHTPASEYEKLRAPKVSPLFTRPKGSGRPTKKERRAFETFDDFERFQ